jgi:zinc protease
MITFGLPDDEWKTYIGRVGGIDALAAAGAAQICIRPDDMLIVVVGDLKQIEPGIKELGYGEIVHLDSNVF